MLLRVGVLVSAALGLDASRRELGRAASGAALCWSSGAAAVPPPWQLRDCTSETNTLYARRTCVRFGLQENRLLSCLPSENCVSTSAVTSPSQFGPPWSYSPATNDVGEAMASLVEALRRVATVREVDEARLYVHATAPSTIKGAAAASVDDMEFKFEPVDKLVLYRSASREAVFFFPPQNLYSVPLSDGNTNRDRLEALRRSLGWQSLGPLYDEVDEDNPDLFLPLRT